MTAAMVALTLGLGVWQVQRLAWKAGLLAEIAIGEASPPRPLSDDADPFRRVELAGRYMPIVAWYGTDTRMTSAGPVSGAYLLMAVERPGQPPVFGRSRVGASRLQTV